MIKLISLQVIIQSHNNKLFNKAAFYNVYNINPKKTSSNELVFFDYTYVL